MSANMEGSSQVPDSTLVKYDDPFVSVGESLKIQLDWTKTGRPISPGFPREAKVPGVICGISIPREDASLTKSELEEILNIMFPPRNWRDKGRTWSQKVSCCPALRPDVLNLHEQLTIQLKLRQAREKGTCLIRQQLFFQCFDELIRQVTINCAERGLLLNRIRDEIQMTIAAHKALYENAVIFTGKIDFLEEFGKSGQQYSTDMQNKIDQTNWEKSEFRRRIHEISDRMEQLQRKQADHIETKEKIQLQESQFLKRANMQLQAQVEGILGTKKPGTR